MHPIVRVIMVGAMTTIAVSALAQTQTKPPPKPANAVKPVSIAPPAKGSPHVTARPMVRHPVFVPAPPVIELDEMAVVPDLPTVLGNEDRDRYRRIFQAQSSNQWRRPTPRSPSSPTRP